MFRLLRAGGAVSFAAVIAWLPRSALPLVGDRYERLADRRMSGVKVATSPASMRSKPHKSKVRVALCVAVVSLFGAASASSALTDSASGNHSAARAWCGGSESVRSATRSAGGFPIRVKARVVRSYYASSAPGRPTYLDLGYAYPNPRRLTVLIWGRDRVNFPRAPERMFHAGTMICAQGLVSRYRGVAQIQVSLWDPLGNLLSL